LITVVCSCTFKAEYPSLDFIQPIHYLVFQVFNFVFKSGDLGGKPVNRDLQVLDYPRKNVDFNLSSELSSLFLI
jgi:hypothetical protein